MIRTLIILGWPLSGMLTFYVWMRREKPLTWRDVFYYVCAAVLGYFLFLIAILVKLVDAVFWDKPVWPR